MSKYMKTKEGSLEESILGLWQEAAKKQEDLDPVDKKAVKKKFKDRKDKDIDNDGDTDSSDEFLHKKRKAISKSMAKETLDKKKKISAKHVPGHNENFEVGTKERTDHTLNVTPGQSPEEFEKQVGAMQSKNNYMREALAKMWGMDEGKNPFVKDPKKEEKKPKIEKTMTGKKATEVKVDPDLDEKKDK